MSRELYVYIRMSSDAQAEKKSSEARQRNLSKAYALEHQLNYKIENEILDLGVSAYQKKRNTTDGNLRKFIDSANAGHIPKNSILLVENQDRLSRAEISEVQDLIKEIVRNDIELVFSDGSGTFSKRDINDPIKLLKQIIEAQRANEESKRRGQNVSRGYNLKKLNAIEQGTIYTGRKPTWVIVKDGKFVLDVEKAAVVRKIFDWTLSGHGMVDVITKLNKAKEPTWRGGKRWRQSNIESIFRNKAVYGELELEFEKIVDGQSITEVRTRADYYPAIVTKDEFYAAIADKKSRYHGGGRKGEDFANIFRGLVYCGNCQRALNKKESEQLLAELEQTEMWHQLSDEVQEGESESAREQLFSANAFTYTPLKFKRELKKESEVYFRCDQKAGGIDCPSKWLNYFKLEYLVLTNIRDLDFSGILNNSFSKLDEKISELKGIEGSLEGQIIEEQSKYDVQARKLFLLEGDENIRLWEQQLNLLRASLVTNKNQLSNTQSDLKKLYDKKRDSFHQVESAKSLIDELKILTKKDLKEQLYDLRTKLADQLNKLILRIRVVTNELDTDQRQLRIYYRDGGCTQVDFNIKDYKNFSSRTELSPKEVEMGYDAFVNWG